MAYVIGAMSGTSMDGVDAILVDITRDHIRPVAAFHQPYPEALLAQLHSLCRLGDNELNICGSVDRAVASVFAGTVNGLLAQQKLTPADILAIGSHGQTVRHYPSLVPGLNPEDAGFTLQIGDPNTLAILTGIDVVSDFRRKDIALGGQGAPLVPAFHHAQFSTPGKARIVVNIGGFANITVLPGDDPAGIRGFDTGPGNVLLDAWCLQHCGNAYDDNGQWAASGKVNTVLLNNMLADPYFHVSGPKSTGREYFNMAWLQQQLARVPALPAEDVQATLLSLTAHTIVNAIENYTDITECFVCGGGAFNSTLMNALQAMLPAINVASTQALGIHPQWVEGVAFAWLAWANLNDIPGNVPAVTGASRRAVLGTFTPAS